MDSPAYSKQILNCRPYHEESISTTYISQIKNMCLYYFFFAGGITNLIKKLTIHSLDIKLTTDQTCKIHQQF